jgi:hypothetical protein
VWQRAPVPCAFAADASAAPLRRSALWPLRRYVPSPPAMLVPRARLTSGTSRTAGPAKAAHGAPAVTDQATTVSTAAAAAAAGARSSALRAMASATSSSSVLAALTAAAARGVELDAALSVCALRRLVAVEGARQPLQHLPVQLQQQHESAALLRSDARMRALLATVQHTAGDGSWPGDHVVAAAEAIARLGFRAELAAGPMNALAAVALGSGARLLRGLHSPDLAAMAWAFARAKIPAPPLFRAIVAEAATRDGGTLRSFAPAPLSSLAWALAAAGHAAPELLRRVGQRVRLLGAAAFGAEELASVAWAVGEHG